MTDLNDLKEPKENKFVQAAAKFLLPLALSNQQLQLQPDPNVALAMRKLHGKPTMIAMNHADRMDPMVAVALSAEVGEDFYYLGARELFDDKFSAWLMQNLGAYSVVRGKPDDEPSKDLTIRLISEGKRKVVTFPEGDITGRDDQILPLKEDGVENIFTAQKRASEPVHVLPVALSYSLGEPFSVDRQDVLHAIEQHLQNSESDYAAHSNPAMNLQDRLRDFAMLVMIKFSEMYGIDLGTQDDVPLALYNLRRRMRARKIPTDFLDVLQQYLIVASTLEQPWTEHVAWRLEDRLAQLRKEKGTPKVQRLVRIVAAEPILVSELMPLFERDRSKALRTFSQEIRSRLQSSLVVPASLKVQGA